MMGHKICLNEKIWTVFPKIFLIPLLIWSSVNTGCLLNRGGHQDRFYCILFFELSEEHQYEKWTNRKEKINK